MSRRVILFTGQWADLPLEELARRTAVWGFDGLELACRGDHFEVDRAMSEADYWGASARCSTAMGLAAGPSGPISSGRRSATGSTPATANTLPPEIWGDGEAEGVRRRAARRRAAQRLQDTARGRGRARRDAGERLHRFPRLAPALHVPAQRLRRDPASVRGGRGALRRTLDVFESEGVRFGLEVHPTEIAYDFVTTDRLLAALGRRASFGINLGPSHFVHQFLDAAAFALEFADRP